MYAAWSTYVHILIIQSHKRDRLGALLIHQEFGDCQVLFANDFAMLTILHLNCSVQQTVS